VDIHQLRVFASVYKHRSFSRASEHLHLTQPTVSDHVKELEHELGCRLFDRLGRTIAPTKEADVLYVHAVEVFDKMDVLREALGTAKNEVSGLLVIGASTIPGTYVMPRVLAAFREKFPAVTFQIVVDDSRGIIDRVAQHEILLGIVGAQVADQSVSFLAFMDDELIVVAAPSFVPDGPVTLADLLGLPLVLREEGSGTRIEMERILRDEGVSLQGAQIAGIFGSTDAVKQAVKAGFGIAMLSRVSVSDELSHGSLKEIPVQNLEMKRKFYIVTHKKRSLPLPYRVFLEHLTHYEDRP
jgi:DNA-binding transcriptional LysR family regulator